MVALLSEKRLGKKKAAVYHQLKDDLALAIEEGMLAPGELLPSEHLLSKQYQISRSSVRSALEELKAEGRIEKRPGKGTYVTDQEKHLKLQSVIRTIGVSLPLAGSGEDWYGSKLLRGMEEVAAAHHCRLAFVNSTPLHSITRDFFDGVISTCAQEGDYKALQGLALTGLYPVLINRITTLEEIAYFSVNYRKEAERAAEYLLSRGHRKIGMVTVDEGGLSNGYRYHGFYQGLSGASLDKPCAECVVPRDQSDEFYEDAIYSYLKEADITAIYLLNGSFAPPLFAAMQRLGLTAPKDLDILCFDDIAYLYPICKVPFIYVKMPLELMARDAATYLINKFSLGKDVPVQKKLYPAELQHCGL